MTNSENPIDRRWKFPVIPSTIRTNFERPTPSQVAAIGSLYIPDLCDAIGRMYTINGLSSLYSPPVPVAGPAFTVKCPPGDNFGLKIALTMTQPGDVLVVDAQGFSDWCLGGFQMLTIAIQERGLKGLIVNGAYRDGSEAREAGFPIYTTGMSPWSGPKLGPLEINVPIACGGVIVEPGDVVTASEDGIAIVPFRHLGRVIEHFKRKAASSDPTQTMGRLRAQDDASLAYLRTIEEEGAVAYVK